MEKRQALGKGLSALIPDAPEAMAAPLHLFSIPDARPYFLRQPSGSGRGGGAGTFRGENEPFGAILTFALAQPGLPETFNISFTRNF